MTLGQTDKWNHSNVDANWSALTEDMEVIIILKLNSRRLTLEEIFHRCSKKATDVLFPETTVKLVRRVLKAYNEIRIYSKWALFITKIVDLFHEVFVKREGISFNSIAGMSILFTHRQLHYYLSLVLQ